MSTHITERNGGTVTVRPRNEKDQTGLIVISHGLGDSAEGFTDVAEMLAKKMPYLKFILPTAPTQKVTMNMGMEMPSWYDIVGLDERSNENCKGLEESRQTLLQILEEEHQNTGLPYSRMALAGFSQGGALSLYTGMQTSDEEKKLAGIVVMSGYLPKPSQFQIADTHKDTPILHCHGTMDPLVQFTMAQKTELAVKQKGATNYQMKTYPIQHTVTPEELLDVQQFLATILPPDESIQITLKDPKTMSIKQLKAVIRNAGKLQQTIGFCEKREYITLVQDIRDGK